LNYNARSHFDVIGNFFVSKIGVCAFQFHKILLRANFIVSRDFDGRYGLKIFFKLAALGDSYGWRQISFVFYAAMV
jgi:hypothetical protein